MTTSLLFMDIKLSIKGLLICEHLRQDKNITVNIKHLIKSSTISTSNLLQWTNSTCLNVYRHYIVGHFKWISKKKPLAIALSLIIDYFVPLFLGNDRIYLFFSLGSIKKLMIDCFNSNQVSKKYIDKSVWMFWISFKPL